MERMTVKDILAATGGRLLCGDENTGINNISLDSRTMKGQDLFVPIIGEKVDAHRFMDQAIGNGAAAVFTSEHDAMDSPAAWIRVEDTIRALQDVGIYYRNRLTLPLIGVTGSVGKTTTREMIACALSAGYKVYKTPGNSNSQVGVPIALSEITDQYQIAVIELGMSEPGELTVIAQIARPDMAVITNIGVAHIEQLGSRENILREKLTIQDGLREGGILLLNGDDELLKETQARPGFTAIYYGTGENSQYRAKDISLCEGYPVFTAVHDGEEVTVRLQVMGGHNVLNAMVSLAVAVESGVPMAKAAEALSGFTGYKNRQQIRHIGNTTIIDDTYNASPASMKAAIDVLCSVSGKRKIAVLADMKELGPDSPEYHYEIGGYLAGNDVDVLVTCGELAMEISRGAKVGKPEMVFAHFMSNEEVCGYLDKLISDGDSILLKGSNSMKLGEVAAHLIQQIPTEKR